MPTGWARVAQPGRRPVHRRSPARRAQRFQAAPGGDLEQPDPCRGAALKPGQVPPTGAWLDAVPARARGLRNRAV